MAFLNLHILFDCTYRANFFTCTTILTFCIIDCCIVVCHCNRTILTCLLAFHTADTTCLTNFSCVCTFISVDTTHMLIEFLRSNRNNVFWTCLCTNTAAHTLVFINNRKTITNLNRLLRTCSNTVTMAKAAI